MFNGIDRIEESTSTSLCSKRIEINQNHIEGWMWKRIKSKRFWWLIFEKKNGAFAEGRLNAGSTLAGVGAGITLVLLWARGRAVGQRHPMQCINLSFSLQRAAPAILPWKVFEWKAERVTWKNLHSTKYMWCPCLPYIPYIIVIFLDEMDRL